MRPPQNPLLTDAGFGANTPSTPNGERAAITTDQAWRALLARNITVIDIIAALNGAIAKGKAQI